MQQCRKDQEFVLDVLRDLNQMNNLEIVRKSEPSCSKSSFQSRKHKYVTKIASP